MTGFVVRDALVLVTGGATGIGRAIADEVVARGGRVVIADIDEGRAVAAAARIGGAARAIACDVSDRASVEALAATIGNVDLAIANAGIATNGAIVDTGPDTFDRAFAVNVKGVWNVAAVFGKAMTARGSGTLCFTASEHALGFQHAGSGIYTATKHAVLGLAEVLRRELPAAVGISVLCPGVVATELYDSGRFDASGGGDDPQRGLRKAIIDAGMPADAIARAALDGIVRGDFYIVTHPHSVKAAQRRYEELIDAFGRQAPMTPDADRHDVNRIVANLLGAQS